MKRCTVLCLLAALVVVSLPLAPEELAAVCRRCQLDGVPCPAGNVACTSQEDVLPFGNVACQLIPGCGSQIFINGSATCGEGDFADCAPLGACCIAGGGCEQATKTLCEVRGVYLGDGTTCGDVNCPPVGGACCSAFSGSCTLEVQSFCLAFEREDRFLGDGTPCETGTCGCCQCRCEEGGACVEAMVPGGCVTACQEIGCTFPIFNTGSRCLNGVCAPFFPAQVPAPAPAASRGGLALIGIVLTAIGAIALLRRRLGRAGGSLH